MDTAGRPVRGVVARRARAAVRAACSRTPGTGAWRNADAAPHTVTGTGFGSNVLDKNGAYSRRFARAGSYAYICALHPFMEGTVQVS